MKKALFALILILGGLICLSVNQPSGTSGTAGTSLSEPTATAEPTAEPTMTPTPTPEPTVEPTEEPQDEVYTLSFGGNCMIGQLYEWTGVPNSFVEVVGDDYSYPFSNLAQYFANDDFTFVNLNNPFTDGSTPNGNTYRFYAKQEYAQVLSQGGIDCVSLANDHVHDFGDTGYKDTEAALDDLGITYVGAGESAVYVCERGLRVGVVAIDAYYVGLGYDAVVEVATEQMESIECDFCVVYVYYGPTTAAGPTADAVKMAQAIVDAGADLVLGSHSNTLFNMETYNDTPIFYSLTNLCYGGHTNPDSKDTAIVQIQVTVTSSGEVTAAEPTVIPCSLSGNAYSNDYCPVPYEEGSDGYNRVMKTLGLTA